MENPSSFLHPSLQTMGHPFWLCSGMYLHFLALALHINYPLCWGDSGAEFPDGRAQQPSAPCILRITLMRRSLWPTYFLAVSLPISDTSMSTFQGLKSCKRATQQLLSHCQVRTKGWLESPIRYAEWCLCRKALYISSWITATDDS